MKKLLIAVIILIVAGASVYAFGAKEETAQADYVNEGIASFNAGNFDQAVAGFKKAVEAKQNTVNAYLGLAYSFAKQDNWEDASGYIYAAITEIPSIEAAFNNRVFIEIGDEVERVIADFEKQLKFDISDIKEELEMTMHFAMADVNRGLMMNADE